MTDLGGNRDGKVDRRHAGRDGIGRDGCTFCFLLERLIKSGALTRAEVADILREARNDLEPYKSIISIADAVGVVGKLAARLRQNPAPLA